MKKKSPVDEWGDFIKISPNWGDLDRFVYYHEPETYRKARELISIQAAEVLEKNTSEYLRSKPPSTIVNLRRWLAHKLLVVAYELDPDLED